MMDDAFYNLFYADVPEVNHEIANGYAGTELKHVEDYIRQAWRNAAPDLPEGLVFVNLVRCTPEESYQVGISNRNGRKAYEMAKCDFYLVKFLLTYHGEPLKPIYTYLPYLIDNCLMRIMGSTYVISGVLADMAFSIGSDNIFVNFERAKITFYRMLHRFSMDGERKNAYVVWCQAHNHNRKKVDADKRVPQTVKANTSCLHYILAKHGFAKTFRDYGRAEVVAGYEDINVENYPAEDWAICQTTALPRRDYTPTRVRLAIRRKDINHTTLSMIAGFFYIADVYPERVLVEYLEDLEGLWRVVLGHFIYANNDSEGMLINNMNAHMTSLDSYVDTMTRSRLRDEVIVDDIYDLFMHLIETFPTRIANAGDAISTMYGKRLTVLRYMLTDITSAIFYSIYALTTKARKGLTKRDIEKTFDKYILPRLIRGVNRQNPTASIVSSPSDCKVFKLSSKIVLQASTTNPAGSRSRGDAFTPAKTLHASIAEVGSYQHITKSEPTGRGHINLFVRLTPDGFVVQKESLKPLLENIQKNIKR